MTNTLLVRKFERVKGRTKLDLKSFEILWKEQQRVCKSVKKYLKDEMKFAFNSRIQF